MGSSDLRDAFNLVAEPEASCSKAFLSYDRSSGQEFQIIEFSGNFSDGVGFSIKSPALGPQADVIVEARRTAELLLKQRNALS